MVSSPNNLPVPIRILIADDHALFRDGLRRLLQAEPGFEVVGEASDGDVLVDLVRKTKPDILLLDLSMPRRDGMEVLRELLANRLSVRTLLLTASIEKLQIVQALRLGAYGVIMKERNRSGAGAAQRGAGGRRIPAPRLRSDGARAGDCDPGGCGVFESRHCAKMCDQRADGEAPYQQCV
jgi:DNA-binding NarL/FixJ family response regulator